MKDNNDIMQIYRCKCVMCGDKAVTLHEEPPKSLNPDWYKQPDKRFALCNSCHSYVHTISRKDAQSLLEFYRTPEQRKALLALTQPVGV